MARQLPRTMRKLICTQLSPKFRESTSIVDIPVPSPGPKEVLVQNKYVGINASDINYTAGRYDRSLRPPFDIGFEENAYKSPKEDVYSIDLKPLQGIGEVVAAGDQSKVKVGQSVLYSVMGAFTEYKLLPSKHVIPVPTSNPDFISFPVSGLTAAIGLDKVGEIKEGEKVLVTAAAGGTGQFAVQLAKLAGCHVIGTCSTDEKVQFLKSLGCDRPINYKKESVKEVLKNEYSKGVDVIYESIGGEMFDICVDSLAQNGRLIVIGFISGYESEVGFRPSRTAALPTKLLTKSASVRGFFLFHYVQYFREYMGKLTKLYVDGKLKSIVDQGETTPNGPFVGLESVADAIDHMYKGTNKGKVVVQISASTNSKL